MAPPAPRKSPAPRPRAAAGTERRPGRAPAAPVRGTVSNAALATAFTAGAPPAPGQGTAGNAAVAAARGAAPAPPARRRPGPHADPKFAALKQDVTRKKRAVATSHPPARTEAAAAQAAAVPPRDDTVAQGKAANAERMNEARPGTFDRDAFIRAVEKAIADKAPKNLDEADKFADSGKAEEVQAEVQGQVGAGTADSAEQIATTTADPPDTSAAVPKPVTPLAGDRPPPPPAGPDPAGAVPDRLPPSATDLSAGPARVGRDLTDARLTESQLRRANEPAFTRALQQKKTAEQHSASAPRRMRAHEAGELNTATAGARRLGTGAMAGMAGRRTLAGQQMGAGKQGAKGRDEEKRTEVTARLQTVFDAMKKDVESILKELDTKVDRSFGDGEKAARDAFTAEHRRRMDEYKDRRYSGAVGKLRWVKDKFVGLPAEADRIFDDARAGYLARMRQVIGDVATLIADELNRAKRRIAEGRGELRAEVERLPAGLRTIGREAAAEFTDRLDDLARTVDDKGTELVDTLATKYTDALKSVDDEIAAEREANKGLVDKAVAAVKGVIETVLELKRLLLGVLAKAATAVMLILKDPIGFLRNLVSAVGAGLKLFLRNIGTHLQRGVISWLMGRATEAGLQLPATFDTRGVLTMIASLLGLTWANIRSRLVRKVPERLVAAAETAVPLVAEVRKRGVEGMWDELRARVGDLRKNLLDKVIGYVTPTIVTAGIMWILSLLNPASAFVRAVKLIIDVVTFVVTRARQIIDFVNAVLDSVIAIARGATGAVPGLIERALARSIPVLLGFLASLLGLGGIANRVKQLIEAVARPVNRAIDWVIDKIVGLVRRLGARLMGTRVGRATVRAGQRVRGAVTAALTWIGGKIAGRTVARPFTMAGGERHTLTAHASDTALRITVASAFAGEIRAVMTQLKKEATAMAPGPDKNAALAAIKNVETHLVRMTDAQKSWLANKSKVEAAVTKRVNKRQARLQADPKKKPMTQAEMDALGKKWLAEKEQAVYQPVEKLLADQIPALSKLPAMKQFVDPPKERLLPPGYPVRTRLYVLGSGWKSKSGSWRTAQKKAVAQAVGDALKLAKPAGRAALVLLDVALQLPKDALLHFDQGKLKVSDITATAYHVDHKKALATQWKSDGHKQGDAERRAHNVDQTNWRLITAAHNTKLQAGGDQYGQQRELGTSFTSEIADGGAPGAKRIDGRPFVDKTGKPIV
ncbi:hypothetical protein ABT354_12875 [Streptomyces sp. NPDC000594]|uniref:hypothetical protein n=1 Tax=Streptomyces sp. NPDC000594 TaxID=3154261 RepID=UPI00331F3335